MKIILIVATKFRF